MKTKALSRAERKEQIIIWFAIRIQKHNLSYATSYSIARGLGLSPSQKLRDMLNEMVESGLLDVKEHNKKGRFAGRSYMLAKGTFTEPRRVLKINGKSVNQEVLF